MTLEDIMVSEQGSHKKVNILFLYLYEVHRIAKII